MKVAAMAAHVGRPVRIWTPFNGEYYGTLEAIHRSTGRAARADVRIAAVLEVPFGPAGASLPFAEGEVLSVAATKVHAWTGPAPGSWRSTAIAAAQALANDSEAHAGPGLRPERNGPRLAGRTSCVHAAAADILANLQAGLPGRSARWSA